MKTVNIYTDGACRGNPGDGGWGVLIKFENNKVNSLFKNSWFLCRHV